LESLEEDIMLALCQERVGKRARISNGFTVSPIGQWSGKGLVDIVPLFGEDRDKYQRFISGIINPRLPCIASYHIIGFIHANLK